MSEVNVYYENIKAMYDKDYSNSTTDEWTQFVLKSDFDRVSKELEECKAKQKILANVLLHARNQLVSDSETGLEKLSSSLYKAVLSDAISNIDVALKEIGE
jgi:nitrogen regulatory protein PII-like uncharacterized protein